MNDRKIKVAMLTSHLEITGIGTVMMNYCKTLDKNKYELTILAGQPVAEKYRQECKENKIRLVVLPSRHGSPKKHYITLWKELKAGHYDIVHDHGNSSIMAIELTIAKLAGIRIRIAHSHNSTCPNMKVHRILNPYFKLVYTKALACGKLAGEWLFGKDHFEVLPNGFHTDDFIFSQKKREAIRDELKIGEQFIIGHIGRINEQKNQEYLLKVFEKIVPMQKNAILLLVGTGPNSDRIRDCIDSHPYKKQIFLYGETDNPTAFYSAMDVFAFPSKFEGFPVVLLEAQISGLPCVVSDKVTKDIDFGDIIWQSIDEAPELWATVISAERKRSEQERIAYRQEHLDRIAKFDISQTVNQLDKIYTDLMKR